MKCYFLRILVVIFAVSHASVDGQTSLQANIEVTRIQETFAEVGAIEDSANLIYYLNSDKRIASPNVEILGAPVLKSLARVLGGYYDVKLQKDFPDHKSDHNEVSGNIAFIRQFKGKPFTGTSIPYSLALPNEIPTFQWDRTSSYISGGDTYIVLNGSYVEETLKTLPFREFALTDSFTAALKSWDGKLESLSISGNEKSMVADLLACHNYTSEAIQRSLSDAKNPADLATVLVFLLKSPDIKIRSLAIDEMIRETQKKDLSIERMNGLIFALYIGDFDALITDDGVAKVEKAIQLTLSAGNYEDCRKIAGYLGLRGFSKSLN